MYPFQPHSSPLPRLRIAWPALKVAAFFAMLHSPVAHPQASALTPQAALTVTAVQPETRRWPETLSANGGLYAWQEVVVAAEIGGLKITEIHGEIGDQVKPGQMLARLSSTTLEASLRWQRALVAQAQAVLAEARADANRARQVKGRGSLSEQQSEQYLIAEQKAKAALDAAEAALRTEEIHLGQTEIRALDAGIVLSRHASLGAVTQVGTELYRLLRQGRIEWRAEVTAEQLALIHPGQSARLHLPTGEILAGQVRQPGPSLDAANRKALIYVDLPQQGAAQVGMFARGELLLDESPALTLPASAVVQRDGFHYVFILDEERAQVRKHKVSIGRIREAYIEITGGLEPATAVVRAGGAFLNDGDRVRLEPSLQPASAPAAPQ